jgi:hypothetical protein
MASTVKPAAPVRLRVGIQLRSRERGIPHPTDPPGESSRLPDCNGLRALAQGADFASPQKAGRGAGTLG